jgi:hypothetical protein
MNSNHNLVQTNNYDQAGTNLTKKVSLYDVYALNHVDVDTNPALAHSLSYSKTDYDASATSHIRTDKLNFRDSTIAIAATQVNDIIKQVFSGNLAVISDNFALNTKLSTDFFANVNVTYNPTLGTYDPLTQKATLDNLFLTGATSGAVATTTSFRGTVDADTISIRSNAKLLTVDGLAGNDTIYGWIQNDSIVGGDGSDVITGRQGADTMTGGKSGDAPGTDNIKDKFVIGNFDSGITVALADTITDFTVGIPAVASIPAAGGNPAVPGIAFVPADSLALGVAGTDKNFVSAPTAAADFAAALINAGLALKALKVAGENGEKFAYENDGANGYLFDDVNGDGVADQVIILTGAPVLNFADIVAY